MHVLITSTNTYEERMSSVPFSKTLDLLVVFGYPIVLSLCITFAAASAVHLECRL